MNVTSFCCSHDQKTSENIPADVDIDSDVTDGNVFGCVNGGNPIIILLFVTDAGTLVIPFKLFRVCSMPKPLFPLFWCGLS